MTLQEFIAANDNKGYADARLRSMISHIEQANTAMRNVSFDEHNEHLERVSEEYFALYGFIMASYGFDRISLNEMLQLTDELYTLVKTMK